MFIFVYELKASISMIGSEKLIEDHQEGVDKLDREAH